MATARFYIALFICLAVRTSQTNCKLVQSSTGDDTLYFRGLSEIETPEDTEVRAGLEELHQEDADLPHKDHTYPIGQPNKNILYVPWWSTFLLSLIHYFYQQRLPNRSQFGVLYMGNVNLPNQNSFPLDFFPHNSDGTPVINNGHALSPPRCSEMGNYVAARPENVQHTMIHAEENILNAMTDLWNAYRNRYGRTPNMLILYSWIMPCPNCTQLIVNRFNQAPFSNVPNRVVAYTVEGTHSNLSYMTREGNRNSRQLLNANNITYWKEKCDRPDLANLAVSSKKIEISSEINTCHLQDTFQGCMVECLGHDLCCTCKESKKKSMSVSLVNDLTKDCAASDMKDCAKGWMHNAFSKSRSGASGCTDLETIRTKVLSCTDTCSGRPLSKPLNPLEPTYFPGVLETFSDISKVAHVELTDFCDDIRTEGYLCNNYRADSFTAGNSLCRSGSICEYVGETYKWCYTDFSNHWDYCCTSACGYGDGTSYMWCSSGTTWQYCGNAGEHDVKKRYCLVEYPCGMHQEKGKEGYYWCYTDTNKNWGKCCRPGDSCSKKGESYNWCYTGYKKNTDWQYCNK